MQNGFVDGTAYGLMIAFIAVVSPIIIASRIIRHETITLRTVAGALCLYLLIGLFFATVYGLLAQVQRRLLRPDQRTRLDRLHLLQLHHPDHDGLRRLHGGISRSGGCWR